MFDGKEKTTQKTKHKRNTTGKQTNKKQTKNRTKRNSLLLELKGHGHLASARETSRNRRETNKKQRNKETNEEGKKREIDEPIVWSPKGGRENAGSVYIRCSTQFSPANSAESVRSLNASLHSVTGACILRKSNPFWRRWPSPDYIWRSDGTCSLLSGGTKNRSLGNS